MMMLRTAKPVLIFLWLLPLMEAVVAESSYDELNATAQMLPWASADASFWNDLSKKRPKSGIDVSTHSKEERKYNIFANVIKDPESGEPPLGGEYNSSSYLNYNEIDPQPPQPPKSTFSPAPISKWHASSKAEPTEETVRNGSIKPPLKVGIVLPRLVFHKRRYQTFILNSLNEISQEKYDQNDSEEEEGSGTAFTGSESDEDSPGGGEDDDGEQPPVPTIPDHVPDLTRSKFFQRKPGRVIFGRARGGGESEQPEEPQLLPLTLGYDNKPRDSYKTQKNRQGSLLEHVRESYDFSWRSTGTLRLDDEDDSINFVDLQVSPPPSDITDILCEQLAKGSAAILYFTNTEKFGSSTAASQYFLQMAGFLGIPVIAWNADNTGLESRAASHLGNEMTGHLQLAPSVNHQVSAMLSILDRYNWRQFGILTSEVAGHDDFVQAVRDQVHVAAAKHGRNRYIVQNVFKVSDTTNWDVTALANSEVRIILLYCTLVESNLIMEQAAKMGLTSNKYLWIVTQSVIGDPEDRSVPRHSLPIGLLGIHFEVDMEQVLQNFLSLGLRVFFHAVDSMIQRMASEDRGSNKAATGPYEGYHQHFAYNLNCQGINANHRWELGPQFYRELLNITLRTKRDKGVRKKIFKSDGSIRDTQLKIMNLKPLSSQPSSGSMSSASSGNIPHAKWEEVGTWNTWQGLDIKDIVWPGGSHVPPQGVPDQFHMKITFLEEPPFIIISDPDPVTSKCSMNRGVPCWMSESKLGSHGGMNNGSSSDTDHHIDGHKCCSGLCIDLLTKFVDELGFTFDLVRVADTKWGTFENGKWNGLMHELVSKRTDMVLSALKINADREAAVDFTVPYLESGIAIIVAKRTGIISPTAFLEPFDTYSWMLVALVAIQASAFSIFLFEFLSPDGYDMQVKPGHKFSLFRTYWLVWAVLFQAAVQVDCPRGLTARFMSGIWALFAVVFLALYTANLAAFMIPRKEFHNLEGLEDPKIKNPHSEKPSLKFGTIPYSYSEVTLKKYFPEMYAYMKQYNRFNATDSAMKAVKDGELDAFIYDGTVLHYLASQDEECRLLQVGSWSAMTGYALAFPTNSKYRSMFNDKLLELQENGDLERLSRFWMSGTCKPNEQEKRASEPLSIAQFLSAFLLLGIGTMFSFLLFMLEHLYMRYLRNNANNGSAKIGQCCGLISQSIGQSYFRGSVDAKNEEEEEDSSSSKEDGMASGDTQQMKMRVKKSRSSKSCENSFVHSSSPPHCYQKNCQDSDLCDTQLTHLESELGDAKRQIRFLEGLLTQYSNQSMQIDSFRRNGLPTTITLNPSQPLKGHLHLDDDVEDPEEVDDDDEDEDEEEEEEDEEEEEEEEEGSLWLDTLPPLPCNAAAKPSRDPKRYKVFRCKESDQRTPCIIEYSV